MDANGICTRQKLPTIRYMYITHYKVYMYITHYKVHVHYPL